MPFVIPPELNPSPRLLMGPGPTMVHPRVLRAMSTPLLGYLDPEFVVIMDETQALLRHVFQTENTWTLPVSGTGMAGMESLLANLLEPGERLLVCAAGYFGSRLEEVARRHGIVVTKLEKPAPDYAVVTRGFLAGRNHPQDVPGMAVLFRRFRHLSYLDRAIGIWARGDADLAELDTVARELHQPFAPGLQRGVLRFPHWSFPSRHARTSGLRPANASGIAPGPAIPVPPRLDGEVAGSVPTVFLPSVGSEAGSAPRQGRAAAPTGSGRLPSPRVTRPAR